MRLWLGKRSTSMWCWALNCSTNLRGHSTLRSLRTTLMHPGVRSATSPETVRIGAMLAYTPLDEKSIALLLNYLHSFLKYLAKNSTILFSASHYEVAPLSTIGKPCEAPAPTHIWSLWTPFCFLVLLLYKNVLWKCSRITKLMFVFCLILNRENKRSYSSFFLSFFSFQSCCQCIQWWTTERHTVECFIA